MKVCSCDFNHCYTVVQTYSIMDAVVKHRRKEAHQRHQFMGTSSSRFASKKLKGQVIDTLYLFVCSASWEAMLMQVFACISACEQLDAAAGIAQNEILSSIQALMQGEVSVDCITCCSPK
jgi:hypothetical protein